MSLLWVDSFPVDLMVSGDITLSSDITDAPVEDGSDVSDNVSAKPIEITTEGLVSDTPIGDVALHPTRQTPDSVTASALFGAVFADRDLVPLPSAEAYDLLYDIWSKSRVVTVELPVAGREGQQHRRVFQNMGIENLTIPITKDEDGGFRFTCHWKQLRFQTNRRITVRTSVPYSGVGGAHKTAPGKPLTTSDVVLWRRGSPPGGPLPAAYTYYFVQPITIINGGTTDGSDLVGSGSSTQTATTSAVRAWRFTGKGAERDKKFGHFNFAANVRLSDQQQAWFELDMARDTRGGAAAQLRDIKNPFLRDQGGGTLLDQRNDPSFYRDHDQLPPGMSLDRFTPPPADAAPRNDPSTRVRPTDDPNSIGSTIGNS